MAKENIEHKGSENLIPFSKRTKEEAREMGRKGGKASGRKRLEKRAFKELLDLAFSTIVTNRQTGEQATRKEVSAIRLAERCVNGDIKAIKLAAELMGENIKVMDVDLMTGGKPINTKFQIEILKKEDDNESDE